MTSSACQPNSRSEKSRGRKSPELSCNSEPVHHSPVSVLRHLFFAIAAFVVATGGRAQGLVNFINDANTLISVGSPGATSVIVSPPGSYYFALLIAEPGTTQPNLFAFSGLYATNFGAGRINGGVSVPVSGWIPGTSKSFMVFGWPASEGPAFNPGWLNGQVILSAFGMSSIGTGIAGGFDPNTGQVAPPLPIFGGSGSGWGTPISVGFSISRQCLSCDPPHIVTQPQNQLAFEGMNVQFTVGAILTPSLSYQWFSNNTPISGAFGSVLTLTNISRSQDGTTFHAIASNPWGSAMSSSATLYVSPVVLMLPGLSISGQSGIVLQIDKKDDLADSPSWSAMHNLVLSGAQDWFFDDSVPATQRFYRLFQSAGPPSALSAKLQLVPSITLNGFIGSPIQVDYLGQLAPTLTWVPLTTVVLTNSPQLFFDITAIGQPLRFYHLIPQ